MNINDFKQHLQHVHGTLDDDPANKQMKDRLSEGPVNDMKEYKPNVMKDKSTHKPTTGAGDTLRPDSKTAEKMHSVKEETTDEAVTYIPDDPEVNKYWGGKKKADELRRRLGQRVSDDDTNVPKVTTTKKTRKKKRRSGKQLELFAANQYFESYFGDNLTEDTSEEDILEAVDALVELCADVCDAVGLSESSAERKAETRKRGKYKYGTGPKPWPGGPGKGASKEDAVYHARDRGQGETVGRGGRRVTGDILKGGTLHNRKQGVTKNEYEALKKRYPGQIK